MSSASTKTSRFLSRARDELYFAIKEASGEAMTPEQRNFVFGYLLLLADDINDVRKAMSLNPNKDYADVPSASA